MNKKIVETEIYTKNGLTVIADKSNLFVYEVSVYCRYKNYFSLVNKKYYSSPNEIPGTISSFYKNPHTEICCELFSAPLEWLLENDYKEYVKPDKKQSKNKIKDKDGK